MQIRVKRVHPYAKLPTYAKPGDSGMDLHSVLSEIEMPPGEIEIIPTGICLEIPEGYEGQVRPRSGLSSNDGLIAVLGTIDSGYRGEVNVILRNIKSYEQTVKRGDRVAQLVIAPVARAELVEVDELSETERGTDGFGSTGVSDDAGTRFADSRQ